ncbi:MAG: AAA family ATPase [Bacteroidota bacterium]
MFLEKIVLHNIRCFAHLEIDFFNEKNEIKNKTIILGNNGTGKSTILKSIALVTSGSNAIGELLGKPNDWIKKGAKKASIAATLRTADNRIRKIDITFEEGDSFTMMISRNQKSLLAIDKAIEKSKRNYFTIGYGVNRRTGNSFFRRRSSNFDTDRAENVATLFSADAYLFPLDSWIFQMDYYQGEVGLHTIKKALNKLLPGVSFLRPDKGAKSILFETKDGVINFNELSDGYKVTANWFSDLLYRIMETFQDYQNALNARFLLLIDEIGLHLHPSWQRTIMETITTLFPNAQIICTTHSPFVAQQANSGELYTVMRNESSGLELFNYKSDPSRLLIHQIIMSNIFGLDTDESVYVENLKNDYKNKNLSEKVTKRGIQSFDELESKLSEIPMQLDRTQNLFDDDYLSLMNELKSELKRNRGND